MSALTDEQLANLLATARDYKRRGVGSLVWRTADIVALAAELTELRAQTEGKQ